MANVVIATSNAHKVEEYKALMADDSIELQSLLDYPGFPDVEENGTTFTENASIKAIAASKYCDAPAFADDSGLEVFALNGEPGIYSSRYAPTDPERIAKLLKNLEGKEDRSARFVCVIAIAFNGEIIETFEGEIRGTIGFEPKGSNGFGYDPVFIPEGETRTFAELSSEEKNRISHRANAFRKAAEFVEEQLAALNAF
ncbi:MAG: RdgB/HAM1 family non-canonical purine NTP pyrophosphatase [Lentisphaeria bacterium]|nr:RdgB/HAM1 family non-canonical purine NTP pyrophosphatase [Lentisphaeria bacterium]